MRLDGGAGDAQPLRDVLVRRAGGHRDQHVHLALGEPVLGQAARELGRQLDGHELHAEHDRVDRLDQLLGAASLQR
ncbi:hypothetical protein ACFJIX_24755 [Roseateles sp. UC29_93]|uniref:hypothetical protein n=1 Tax=Roseateles sp. UC29_93 TaxID=3350177 RepID=UPI0036706FA6